MKCLISLLLANLLFWQPAFATLNDTDKQQVFSKNLLVNGGFENGKAQWTPNDTADFTTSTTTPLEGGVNAEWDADASTDTLTSTAVTIPSGWYGRNGVASCLFVTPSGTATHEIQAYDGSNVLSEATITSSTSPTRTSTNFIFPSSGSVSLRIYANADEPNLEIDSCFLGPAEGYNVSSVSQATFVGGMENAGASTCGYAETSSTGTSDFDDLGTGSSCAAWTVVSNGPGTISAQGTNDHRLVYTNMPPGNYKFELDGIFIKGGAAVGACSWRLSDGTNTYQAQGTGNNAAQENYNPGLNFHVTVTTAGTRTYNLQAADSISAGGCQWFNNANYPASWKVYRFPTSSEQAYTPDLQAMSWSGYHASTCSWARTNTAYGDPTADATCTLTELTNQNFGSVTTYTVTNAMPGIVFTPKKAGRYYACAHGSLAAGALLGASIALFDDSTKIAENHSSITANTYSGAYTLCGIVVATSTAAKTVKLQTASTTSTVTLAVAGAMSYAVSWSIVSIDQSLPAPVLTNMVTTPSSGGVRIASAVISSAGAISTEDGDWISGSCAVTDTSLYTCTLVTGTFSAKPKCQLTPSGVDIGYVFATLIDADVSSTQVKYRVANAATVKFAFGVTLTCIGAR